jgi:hypothetical protein
MAVAAANALGRPVHRIPVQRGLIHAIAALNAQRRSAQILTPAKVRELFHPDWVTHDRRLTTALGWTARYGLAQGFRHTILWYREHHWL